MLQKEVVSNLSSFFIFGASVVVPLLISNKIENVKSINNNASKLESFMISVPSDIESNLKKFELINTSLNSFKRLKVIRHGRGRYLFNKRKKYFSDIITKNIKSLKKINLLFLSNLEDNELIRNLYFKLHEYNEIIDDLNDSLCLIENDNLKGSEVLQIANLIDNIIEKHPSMIKYLTLIAKENSTHISKLNKYINGTTYVAKALYIFMISCIVIEIICVFFLKFNLLSNTIFQYCYYGIILILLFFVLVVSVVFGVKNK